MLRRSFRRYLSLRDVEVLVLPTAHPRPPLGHQSCEFRVGISQRRGNPSTPQIEQKPLKETPKKRVTLETPQ